MVLIGSDIRGVKLPEVPSDPPPPDSSKTRFACNTVSTEPQNVSTTQSLNSPLRTRAELRLTLFLHFCIFCDSVFSGIDQRNGSVQITVEKVPLGSAETVVGETLIVGSVAYDNIVTPYMSGNRILGGSASYASLAASYFTTVRLVGIVGDDFDDASIRRLENRGICLEGLQRDNTGPTFHWSGRYHANFNRRDTLDTQLNVFENFRPNLPTGYKSSPYVLLGNIEPALQAHVLAQMEGSAFIIADTMDLWINTRREALLEVIRRVDCCIINDIEAPLLTGEKNFFKAGWRILELGPKMAILKKGEHGSCLFHPDGLFALPAYPVTNLQDPTGAGDSFAGSLLGYLAAVNDTSFSTLKQAMLYATVTASLTVEAFSCDRLESAGPTEIVERYKKLVSLISP